MTDVVSRVNNKYARCATAHQCPVQLLLPSWLFCTQPNTLDWDDLLTWDAAAFFLRHGLETVEFDGIVLTSANCHELPIFIEEYNLTDWRQVECGEDYYGLQGMQLPDVQLAVISLVGSCYQIGWTGGQTADQSPMFVVYSLTVFMVVVDDHKGTSDVDDFWLDVEIWFPGGINVDAIDPSRTISVCCFVFHFVGKCHLVA